MAASPVKFLFGFLILSISLWMLFIFASRLVAWVLSRVLGASVSFRVGGWKCLRDVVVKFKKGAVESICIGEVKLSLRQSLVKLGVGFISRDPKLQIVICDIEVVLRPSNKSKRKSKNRKPRSSGRGKWMIVANIARFLSISVTDLVVKLPKATAEVKLLSVDIFKDVGAKPDLLVKLHIIPIIVHICDSRVSCDQSTCVSSGQTSCTMIESSLSALSSENFSLTCVFGHDREVGVVIRDVDMTCGEVIVNLNEEMLVNNKTSSEVFHYTDKAMRLAPDSYVSETPNHKHGGIEALSKYSSFLPEKVSFNLPRLDVRFVHQELNLSVENNIMGIQLKSIKSRSAEDVGESTRLDVQVDFSEIHLLREVGRSVMEILKVNVIVSVYIPIQPTLPIRAEIDVKLGGTQCNIIISRLEPWLNFQSSKTKKMMLRKDTPASGSQERTDFKAIMWTCTVSAPEMIIMLYSMSGLPLYHGCSQSSHVFANNISTAGTAVHMELGELNLDMTDEHHESFQESIFGVESNSGSLLNIAKLSLDWGKKDTELLEDCNNDKCKLVLFVDVTGMGVYFTIKRIESLIVTVTSFQYLLKNVSAFGKGTAQRHGGRTTKSSGKGTQLMKVNLERCSVSFCGDTSLDNAVVLDPKRVNYGSQGGRTVINVSADGTNRRASIKPSISSEIKRLKYSVSLDIFHFSLCVNKIKRSTQMELERARSIYQEYLEEYKPSTKLTLFDMQNAKFVRRFGGLKNIAVCSLFSATDIAVKWEPDVHICLFELVLHMKLLIHSQKLHGDRNIYTEDVSGVADSEKMKEATVESGKLDKHKEETLFAVDVEMLSISAEVGDGVEATLQVQSIFSENARIGVLMEGLMLSFNGSRILKSSRMQISRVPNASSGSPDLKSSVPVPITLDWVIQGLDIHICMPYRLQMRAIDDSVEDMLRGLKLIATAKRNLILPMKKDSPRPKKSSSTKFGSVKFCIRKLTVDIEEEPIQGWLDEHCHLLKKEACELAVRLNFVDELISRSSEYPKTKADDSSHQRKLNFNGVEIDIHDPSAVEKLREEIYKQSFRSYYLACQKLDMSEGSGACREGFQAGFRPSAKRNSLLSVCATELEVVLTKVDGGDDGMIEIIRKLDPISLEHNIPFSRLYGSNIFLQTNTLAVQLRNFTFPLFLGTSGKCEGRVVLAQQATCFQPQIYQDVCVGKWRIVRMLRSESGTTPPVKTYSDLPIHFQRAEISFGVGYEPAFADISYAFTIALRRANLSVRNSAPQVQLPKKERSLPWWDDMRNYVHGNVSLFFSESRWILLATTDPYEKLDKLQIVSASMELHQSDGRVYVSAKEFKILISSLESLANRRGLQFPAGASGALIEAPAFSLEVTMVWECDSGSPLNHYLFALPVEGKPREKVFDPFRSTSLSLRWNLCLRPSLPLGQNQSMSSLVRERTIVDATVYDPPFRADNVLVSSPTLNIGAHDLAWLLKFWSLNYLPPHKLRAFSRWPRYKVARAVRSGNLSMDKVMTEFMFRIDAMPACIKHMPLDDDDPAKGLTFNMTKLKYELCYSRGKQKHTFECKRDPLDLVYQGLDLHMPKVFLNKEGSTSVAKVVQVTKKTSQSASMDKVSSGNSGCREKNRDDGFLLSSDYFTIRRQAPKADPARLLAWQEAGRRNLEMTYVRSEFENGSDSDEHARSDPSDDDGYNVVIADNCQRVFIYGLRLLWTVENRDAIWSWVGGISKALEPQKPSPSRQYAQRKLAEELGHAGGKVFQNDTPKPPSNHDANSPSQHANWSGSPLSPAHSVKGDNAFTSTAAKNGGTDDCNEEEGTRHFMVNVIEPQFNFHSEEANGRFLLAAVSGRVLARSFHSVLHVGYEMIEQVLCTKSVHIPESAPEMTWKRMEFSVMLEHVQAHVAPTDVDPGAGLQWLPKIRRSSPKVKRTGALLERVFMPCDMYFRYTRHKGGTQDLKVKPLKELTFNSHNITATMTSRQFQVMLDVLTNLLFARLPKPRKNILSYPAEDDEDVEEEEYEVIPDGVEEVELAKIHLERKEREQKVLLDDIKKLSLQCDALGDLCSGREGDLWMLTGGLSIVVRRLKKELANAKMSKKEASVSLRMALHKAAQLRLMEKEKNKSPSYAMRISLQINKVVWSMLVDGKSFAEAEINDMIFDFDRDYKDIGVSQFTTKYFVVRNCLPNAKSDMLLSAWDPPSEWGKKFMLRVDAKQGSPKDGNSPLELFQVEIYPLKIHLTETMYRMMWEYFFPEEEQDSQRRQEVWLDSTTGLRRVKKGSSVHEASASATHSAKESEAQFKLSASVLPSASINADSTAASKLQHSKGTTICSSTTELRRTCSLERAWEETMAETVANELVVQAHSSTGSLKPAAAGFIEQSDESSKGRVKDSKSTKSGRSSHEEKKAGKSHEEKRSRPRKVMEFHNIKISQVKLLVTYEGSRFVVNDLKLLMDTFQCLEFTGTWRRLFSRVKKHIIWGVLKSVTGMQGKKLKDKAHSQRDLTGTSVPDSDLNLSDNEGGLVGKADQHPITWLKRPSDGAGDGFVTSIRGLFNTQRRKAKAFVLRTMRGEVENDYHGEWSESDGEFSPFARQLTITKAKRLIRRHTKKFRSRGHNKGSSSQQRESLPSSPREMASFGSDSSDESSPYEDFHE